MKVVSQRSFLRAHQLCSLIMQAVLCAAVPPAHSIPCSQLMTPIYSTTFICSFLFFYKTLHIDHFIASKFKVFPPHSFKNASLKRIPPLSAHIHWIFFGKCLLSDILSLQVNQSIKCHPPWKQIYKEKCGGFFSYSGGRPWQCNESAIVSVLTL